MKIIHKKIKQHPFSRHFKGNQALCGWYYGLYWNAHFHWKHVTCKECLERK